MSLYTFFGCLFTAYGPILAIFFLYIGLHAQHVLLTVASAFFCLFALLISSVIWYLAKPVQHNLSIAVMYSVAIQELFRWFYFLLLQRAEKGMNAVTRNPRSPYNRILYAFVAGYGYALTTSLVSYISVLAESLGPGMLKVPSYHVADAFFVYAVTTTLFSLLHMAWMIIAFDGFATGQWIGTLEILWVIVSHYGASYSSLLSTWDVYLGCIYAIVIQVVILGISIGVIYASLTMHPAHTHSL
ncbi:gamma-secretase subunit Aph-1 [Gongronella butleri]|nr:gamma-secretase subunit Aph-1 [Gongronella butleri]